jgi:hypothetical protein
MANISDICIKFEIEKFAVKGSSHRIDGDLQPWTGSCHERLLSNIGLRDALLNSGDSSGSLILCGGYLLSGLFQRGNGIGMLLRRDAARLAYQSGGVTLGLFDKANAIAVSDRYRQQESGGVSNERPYRKVLATAFCDFLGFALIAISYLLIR